MIRKLHLHLVQVAQGIVQDWLLALSLTLALLSLRHLLLLLLRRWWCLCARTVRC